MKLSSASWSRSAREVRRPLGSVIDRRSFLAIATLALGGRQAAQDTAQTVGAADPLMDPAIAGQPRAVVTPLDNDETLKATERRLKCNCGCNLDIFTCRTTDFTCTYSPALHQEVVALFQAGKTPEEIVAAFVAKYGEQTLLAPTRQGFNLVGYLLPGSLVVAVAGALAFILLRRHRLRLLAAAPAVVRPVAGGLSPDQEQQLARALGEVET